MHVQMFGQRLSAYISRRWDLPNWEQSRSASFWHSERACPRWDEVYCSDRVWACLINIKRKFRRVLMREPRWCSSTTGLGVLRFHQWSMILSTWRDHLWVRFSGHGWPARSWCTVCGQGARWSWLPIKRADVTGRDPYHRNDCLWRRTPTGFCRRAFNEYPPPPKRQTSILLQPSHKFWISHSYKSALPGDTTRFFAWCLRTHCRSDYATHQGHEIVVANWHRVPNNQMNLIEIDFKICHVMPSRRVSSRWTASCHTEFGKWSWQKIS